MGVYFGRDVCMVATSFSDAEKPRDGAGIYWKW